MNEQQRNQFIAEKLNEGLKLNEIQKILETEYDLRMTYLDLRMLAAELEVDWSKQEPPKPEPNAEEDSAGEQAADELSDAAEDLAGAVEDVVVTVSKLARPDAAISGSYTCPSGAKGEWIVDNYGRPGLIPTEGSPKPTQEEMKKFQEALVSQLQSSGM